MARGALQGPVLREVGALLPTTRDPLRVYVTELPGAEQQQAAFLVVAVRHGAPAVSLTVDRIGRFARLRVVDAGHGMDPDLLATATQHFTRSAASRSREGFGLGLSLVERIVSVPGVSCAFASPATTRVAGVPPTGSARFRATTPTP